jgi:dihydrodipicolinate synthase/N-acetylneuraminate lyase
MFEGLIPALITLFDEDGKPDFRRTTEAIRGEA